MRRTSAVTLGASLAGACLALLGAAAVRAQAVVAPSAQASAAPIGVTSASGAVVLHGLGEQSETLTAAAIARLPHEQVSLTHDDKTVVYAGPRLDDLLRDVDAPLGPRIHGPVVADVLIITGADNYRAVLSLAEVDPSFHRGAKVILADQADGRSLDAHDGPFRLVVDGDLRGARSVHSVVAIALKHLP